MEARELHGLRVVAVVVVVEAVVVVVVMLAQAHLVAMKAPVRQLMDVVEAGLAEPRPQQLHLLRPISTRLVPLVLARRARHQRL